MCYSARSGSEVRDSASKPHICIFKTKVTKQAFHNLCDCYQSINMWVLFSTVDVFGYLNYNLSPEHNTCEPLFSVTR